jgi:hypothetical protein
VPDELPDLRSYIDHVIETGVTDPADIAVKVRQSAPAEVLEAHMLHFLTLAVRQRQMQRISANAFARGAAAKVRRSDAPLSVKRQRQRDQWAAQRARWLADSFSTGTRRVTLGEATAADLIAAAAYRRSQASELVASAQSFEEIAALPEMQREGMTVGQLPDAVLRRLAERP